MQRILWLKDENAHSPDVLLKDAMTAIDLSGAADEAESHQDKTTIQAEFCLCCLEK
jgi:hypothetical protein